MANANTTKDRVRNYLKSLKLPEDSGILRVGTGAAVGAGLAGLSELYLRKQRKNESDEAYSQRKKRDLIGRMAGGAITGGMVGGLYHMWKPVQERHVEARNFQREMHGQMRDVVYGGEQPPPSSGWTTGSAHNGSTVPSGRPQTNIHGPPPSSMPSGDSRDRQMRRVGAALGIVHTRKNIKTDYDPDIEIANRFGNLELD